MNTRARKQVIWDNVLPQTVTSSTDTASGTPIVVTKVAHGYTTGQLIMIQGHATNIAANGIFYIVVLTANTFQLFDLFNNNLAVSGSGAGAGSGGIMVVAPNIIYCEEFRTQDIQFFTSGSATLTAKVAISSGVQPSLATSYGTDLPHFGSTISITNPYSLADIIDLSATTVTVSAATGIVASGTDLAKTYEINTNLQKYMTLLLTGWSAGRITAIANVTNQQ